MWFAWAMWSTAAVVVGLVGELPELWHEGWSKYDIREKKLREPAEWVKPVAFFGWFLIVAGVAGELAFGMYVSSADGMLQDFTARQLIEARAETESVRLLSSLNELKAAELNTKASTLSVEAARLAKKAEGERLARVKIEARVAWRHLTGPQQADMAQKLGDFGNQVGASLWFQTGDTESEMFAADMGRCLQKARVVVQPPAGMVTMRESGHFGDPIKPVETGVIVQSTKHERSRALADAIVRELNARGFDAKRQTNPPFDDRPQPIVWLDVWPRPEGPQGEYKLQAEREAKQRQHASSQATNR
jgi:hypothetical protein